MVWVMSNKNMKEVFFCCKYNWLFFPFNVGLNNLFPLWRSVAFVILLFGDRTKIGPTWKGYWIKSQICHRFIYHRHLPPIFSDCLSQLMPVTEFFLPHQSASIQLWEYIYIWLYMEIELFQASCTWILVAALSDQCSHHSADNEKVSRTFEPLNKSLNPWLFPLLRKLVFLYHCMWLDKLYYLSNILYCFKSQQEEHRL